MKRSHFLSAAVALSLVTPFGSGGVSRLPNALPGGSSDRSFPLQASLHASDAQASDGLGWSVAVSGNVAIVGAMGEAGGIGDPMAGAGAAYVFQRNRDGASQWGQVQKLTASDAQSHDQFGYSVAVSGEYAIVGAAFEAGGPGDPADNAGAAYVFRRDQGGASNWGQVQKLTAPDADPDDYFGTSVAIFGDTAVVGAFFEDGGLGHPEADAGAAYVFQNIGGFNWLHVKTLRASDSQPGDRFGNSVAISGDTALVGAFTEDGGSGDPVPLAGAAYIFGRNQNGPNEWGEVERLMASDPGSSDQFGYSVAISGNLAVVGAIEEDGGLGDPVNNTGAAYVFQNLPGSGWTHVKKLTAADASASKFYGRSVAMSGGVVLVGAHGDRGGPNSPMAWVGAAYVHLRHLGGTNVWGQAKKLTAPDAQPGDKFGLSVALSGRNAVVGANAEDGGLGDPLVNAGAAYVYYVSLLKAFKAN